MNGLLRAHVSRAGRASVVTDLLTGAPLAAKVLAGAHGTELVLIGSAAGLLEGDRLDVFLTLEPGTALTVRSTAATLAHPCPGGGATRATVTAVLGAGARLAWLPEPLVACAGCRHGSRTAISLAPGAAALWYEATTLGRTGEAAGALELRLDATLAGRPLLRDGFTGAAAASPAVLGPGRHTASLHLLGRRCAGFLDLAGPGATARAVAGDAAGLHAALAPAREQFLAALFDPPVDRPPAPKETLVHD